MITIAYTSPQTPAGCNMKRGMLGLAEEAGERNAGGRGAGETKRNLSTIPSSASLVLYEGKPDSDSWDVNGRWRWSSGRNGAPNKLRSKDVCADT